MNTITKAIFLALLASASADSAYDDSSISTSNYVHDFDTIDANFDEMDEFIETENSRCVGNPRPGGIRRSGGSNNGNGPNFRFNLLNDGNEQCTDRGGRTYSFGTFNNIRSFEDCADKCVQDSPIDLINDGVFRGFDFNCRHNQCNCLFDAREFNIIPQRDLVRSVFRTTNQRGRGNDGIDRNRGRSANDIYCGTLVGFNMEDAELETSRALRGSTN